MGIMPLVKRRKKDPVPLGGGTGNECMVESNGYNEQSQEDKS